MDSLSIFCYVLYKYYNKTQEEIGELIGKHHATVIYHLQRFQDRIAVHKGFKKSYEDFRIKDFVETYSQKKIQLEPLTVADVAPFLIH
ncbi:hypothetical protein [Epilithonimonas sp. UC225_85]|uniref:hypothetical protein n=1 Tax=Epilithonimonas sp. UC225_85 TaxID=3350167 RepID=UPI0036D2B2CE